MKSAIFLSYPSSLAETPRASSCRSRGRLRGVSRPLGAAAGRAPDARIHAAVGRVTLRLPHHAGICFPAATRSPSSSSPSRGGAPGGARPPGAGRANADRIHSTFLRAVTILKPQGNLVAEVTAEVGRPTAPWWRGCSSRGDWAGGHRRASSPAAHGSRCPPISSAASRTPRWRRSWAEAGRKSTPVIMRARGRPWSRPTRSRRRRAMSSRRRSSWP